MGKLRANSEIISDKSKNPVTTSTYIKHGNQWLDDAVNNAIGAAASKADKTYVDSELTKKANKSDTDAALSSKADKSELSTKADKSALEATNASVSANTSNIQELSTESTVLSARMDEFTKLEEGSTTGDAELIDGRIGSDGKTYDNIGGAIRGQVTDLKSDLSRYENIFTADVDESVSNWLEEHPEATTTVQDGSLTIGKMVIGTLGYVTPEMFGAIGDGITDDTEAIQNAIDTKLTVLLSNKTYLISETIKLYGVSVTGGAAKGTTIRGGNATKIKASDMMTSSIFEFYNESQGDARSYGVTIDTVNIIANENIEKVINCNDYNVSECVFENVAISYGVNGFYFDKNCYLCTFTNCRVYHVSGTGFHIVGGTNTSNVFTKCYVDSAKIGFYVSGYYCNMISCCADVISDVVYKFQTARFNLSSCGSESGDAKKCFEINTNCFILVSAGFFYGNPENSEAIHIDFVGVNNRVTFISSWLNVHTWKSGATKTPGKLYEFPSQNPRDMTNTLYFSNCYMEEFETNCENISYFYKVHINNANSDVKFRYSNTIPYLGCDSLDGNSIESESAEPVSDGNAIFMGFDTKNVTSKGENISNRRKKSNGDIVLTKNPAYVGGIGWVTLNSDNSDRWSFDKTALIPIVQAGTEEEKPADEMYGESWGAMYYNTTTDQMNFWNGQKFTDKGTYKRMNETLATDSNGILTTDVSYNNYALLSCFSSTRIGWIFTPFYDSGNFWKIKVTNALTGENGSGDYPITLNLIKTTNN